jgi:hypothetical protein
MIQLIFKQLLDPYDNESYGKGEDPLVVDTLIAETNAGSLRWMHGLEQMPVTSQKIKDGELSEYLLPHRGYSVAELAQMEEEKLAKERELLERREKEEYNRLQREYEERQMREAAEAMMPFQFNATSIDTFNASTITFSEPVNGDLSLLSNFSVAVNAFESGVLSTIASNISLVQQHVDESLLVPDGTFMAEEPEYIKPSKSDYPVSTTTPDSVNEFFDTSTFTFADTIEPEKPRFDDESTKVIDDVPELEYLSYSFDSEAPFKVLPWFDEVGPDGKEYRLSQMLADEEWEEEVEAAKEKASAKTYDEYLQRKADLEKAAVDELIVTEKILNAAPSARGTDLVEIAKESKSSPTYDQTKLDGISQLMGLLPGEISDIPSYIEPSVPPEEDYFDSISQLWGQTISSSSLQGADDTIDSDDFDSIAQLWGEPIIEPRFGTQRVTGTQKVTSTYRSSGTQRISEGKELRLSQMLADEDWSEELEPPPPPIETFAEFQKQVANILKAEASELLETEAILKAPPAADSVDLKEDEIRNVKAIKAPNSTSYDDLAPLEMDVSNRTDDGRSTTAPLILESEDPLATDTLDSVVKIAKAITDASLEDATVDASIDSPPKKKKKKKDDI